MIDRIRESFLLAQEREIAQLAETSDILSVSTRGPRPHERFVLSFRGRSVVRGSERPTTVDGLFIVGVWLPADYLFRAETPRVLTWLDPVGVHHPNVYGPFVCLGRLVPGTPLPELAHRLWAIVSYQSYGLVNPLNHEAARWARHNLDRFPIDPRPLKRRVAPFRTEVFERGGAA